MQNQTENKSGNPLLIIGAMFLLVLIAGWWFYSSSKSKPNTANTATNPTQNEANNYATASVGAQPAHILGSPTATVVVEEFADYQCPTCGVKHPEFKQIASIYNNRIKFIFRNFPLTQMHPKAYDAAIAAEAAGLQNKFWDMQNMLFTKQAEWSASTDHRKLFSDYAQQIGLDVTKFQGDILGLPAKQRVDADLQRAKSMQVSSTPSVYINGIAVPFNQMNVDGMRQLIDSELQKAASQPRAGDSNNTAKPESSPEANSAKDTK